MTRQSFLKMIKMKNNLLFLFILLSLLLFPTISHADLNTGLIAYYPFNGNANDESGNGNHGDIAGHEPTLTTDRFGSSNSAYSFDGVDDYIALNNIPSSSSFTVTAWAKSLTTNWNNYGFIICSRQSNGYLIHPQSSSKNWSGLVVNSSGSDSSIGTNNPGADITEWHQYVITFDNTTKTGEMFFDGKSVFVHNSMNLSRSDDSTINVMIGMDTCCGPRYGHTEIDDVRIYNRALSDAEIQELYYEGNDLTTGLVAYYPFNGNANDESGNGNHGDIAGHEPTLTADRFGNPNSAYSFDGINDEIEVDHNPVFNSDKISFSFWAKALSPELSTQMLIHKDQLGNINHNYHIKIHLNTVEVQLQNGSGQSNPSIESASGWNHYTFTSDGNTNHKVFINGQFAFSSNLSWTINGNTLPIYFGSAGNGEFPFKGMIDDIRIYDRVLSVSEISALYSGIPSLSTGLMVHLSFDDQSNPTVDDSGNGFDGQNNGAVWDTNGVSGGCMDFGNSNSYITIQDSIFIRPQDKDMSWSVWFQSSDDSDSVQEIFSSSDSSTNDWFTLNLGRELYKNKLRFNADDGSDPVSNLVSSDTYTDGKWHHAVVIRDSANDLMTLYIDGKYETSSANVDSSIDPDGGIYIGSDWFGVSNYFNGKIDDFRIYNRTLSADEIQGLFFTGNNIHNGLIAYYPFRGNADDESGNNKHGSLNPDASTGPSETADRFGNTDSAYHFDGLDDEISLGTWSLPASGSISLWFNWDGTSTKPDWPTNGIFGKWLTTDYCSGYHFSIATSPNNNLISYTVNDNSCDAVSVSTPDTINTNQWYHVVADWGETSNKLYVNGELVATGSGKQAIESTYPMTLGRRRALPGYGYFAGKIDDVRIYDRELLPSEINELYTINSWSNINTAPVIINGPIPDQSGDEDDPAWTVDLTQYESDAEDTDPLLLMWSVSNVNASLISATITDINEDILTITPAANAHGSDTITLTLTDSGGLTDTQDITITLSPVNDPPNPPSGYTPTNGQTGVLVTTDLFWSCSDPDGDNLTYDVYFDTVNPPTALVSDDQSAESYDPGTLAYNTTYYWQVTAKDINSAETQSNVQSFTTEDPAPVPGTLQFTTSSWSTNETDTSVTISVSRTGGSDGAVSVDYQLGTGSTATSGSDFNLTSGTLNWNDGDNTTKTFDVTILDDSDYEPPKTVILELLNVSVASIGSTDTSVLTINDDDAFVYGHMPQPTGRVPDTGQTISYTSIFGEDSDYTINPPSYTKLDASGNDLPDDAVSWAMVRDNITGLIWEIKTDDGTVHDKDNTYTWYDSNPETNGGDAGTPGDGTDTEDFINELNASKFGGFADWRLPTVKELQSIVDYGKMNPAVNNSYFPNIINSYYWTCNSRMENSIDAWYMWFSDGLHYHYSKSRNYHTLAVRGVYSVPDSLTQLISNADGTVTDSHTGLMWQTGEYSPGIQSYGQTLSYCQNLVEAGYSDWRLPTIKELTSIIKLDNHYPSCDTNHFIVEYQHNNYDNVYSTSTTRVENTIDAWHVNFYDGWVDWYGKSNQYFTLAIRGGQSWHPERLYIAVPEQASFWEPGNTMSITWETRGISGNVNISLSRDGGTTFTEIISDTPNDGACDWTVEGPDSVNCMLKIEPVSDSSKGTIQGLFSIHTTPNTAPVIINGPVPDQSKNEDDPAWTIDLSEFESDAEDTDPLLLTWSVSDVGTSLITAEITDVNEDILTITPMANAHGSDTIRLTLIDSGELTAEQNITITLAPVNDPPNPPSGFVPADGQTGVLISTGLSWTCSDPDGDTLTYDVYFDTVNPPAALVSDDQSGLTYDPGTLAYSTTYYWQVIAKDINGIETQGSVLTFTTEAPPPVPGALQFTSASWSADETDTNITISVSRSGGSDGSVSVDYQWSTSSTATSGSDFNLTSGTLNWNDGENGTKAFDVTILDDSNFEPPETVVLELTNVSGAYIGSTDTSVLTINDDDTFTYEHLPRPNSRTPDTGQNTSYTSNFGEDSDYTINPPSYTKLDATGNDLPDDAFTWVMVRDNITGLIWEVKLPGDGSSDYSNPNDADNKYTWYDSNPDTNGGSAGAPGDGTDTEDFINDLNAGNYGGFSDWRLPTVKELNSIIDYGKYPAVNRFYFPNTIAHYHWSSNTRVDSIGSAWFLSFSYGKTTTNPKSGSFYVRAVRGEKSEPPDNLVDNGDGSITDMSTGLMWQQSHVGTTSWEPAISYCETLSLAGFEDWRMPTINEIYSLVDHSKNTPTINESFFPVTSNNNYWSSTTCPSTIEYGCQIYFGNGQTNERDKTSSTNNYVRAVRGGQSWHPDRLYIAIPEQASFWEPGDTIPITWETRGIAGDVNIFLSRDGGSTFTEIISNTPNDGACDWTVEGSDSINCMLRIEPVSDPSKGTTQGLFSIQWPSNTAPVIINGPIPDQTKNEDDPAWTIDLSEYESDVEDTDPLLLTWSVDDVGASVISAEITDSDDDILTITPMANAHGSDTITLTLTDSGGLTAEQNITVTLSPVNDPPNPPSGFAPANAQTGVSISTDLSWSCSDPDGDALTYDVYFDTVNPPAALVSDGQSAETYDPGTLAYSTTYYWQIIAKDINGVETQGDVQSFTTETPPPVPGTLQFINLYSVDESNTSRTIMVTRINGSDGAVSVNYQLGSGSTATLGSDFNLTPGTLNWADGDSSIKTFTVSILDDALFEPPETVILELTDPIGASLGDPSIFALSINSDDPFIFENAPQPTGRIPDTVQTKSYTHAFGEDSDYTINPPSYTKLDASGHDLPDDAVTWVMVRDNVTGLIWEVKTNDDSVHDKDNTYTWYDPDPENNDGDAGTPGDGTDTEDFINELNAGNFGGFSDWRLPTAKELQFIAHKGKSNPSINNFYFPNTGTGLRNYWTSTSNVRDNRYAYHVDFSDGFTSYNPKSTDWFKVKAVRGEQLSTLNNFIDNGDGSITDASTGLMWQESHQGTMRWWGATIWESAPISYCSSLSIAGFNDWRLPNINELISLVDYSKDPTIDRTFFPDTSSFSYWSSTTLNSDYEYAYTVGYGDGYVSRGDKQHGYIYVRAVRGGQTCSKEHLFISIPEQASFWEPGDTMPITWETRGIAGNVNISLSRDGGKTYTQIVSDTLNDGLFDWLVTSPESFNCMLKIEPVSDSSKGTVQGLFSIYAPPIPNTAPVIDGPVPDQTKNEDDPAWTIDLTQYETDAEDTDPLLLTWSVSNVGASLISAEITDSDDDILTIAPMANANGSDTITLTLTDSGDLKDTQDIIVTLNSTNDDPFLVNNNELDIEEGSSKTITSTHLRVDDIDGDLITYQVLIKPGCGDLKRDGDVLTTGSTFTQSDVDSGLITYTHNQVNCQSDNFQFTAGDGNGAVIEQTVFDISINLANQPPVADNDSVSTLEDTPLNGQLTGSDPDDPLESLTYQIVQNSSKGLVNLNQGTGAFTYTPNFNIFGIDSFKFRISDGSKTSNNATVTISIQPVNDPPVAHNESATTQMDTPLSIELTVTDPDYQDILTFSYPANSVNGGTLTGNPPNLIYTPPVEWTGTDTFSFTVNDGFVDSNSATFSILVEGAPEPNEKPVAVPETFTTIEDTPFENQLTGTDADSDDLIFNIATQPSKGVLQLMNAATGDFSYTPDTNANGTDSFEFKVNDGKEDSIKATSIIIISPVNDPPEISGTPDTTVRIDEPYSFQPAATDPDTNDTLVYTINHKPAWTVFSTTTGLLSGVPGQDDVGTTTSGIIISVSDGTLSDGLPPFDLTVLGSIPITSIEPMPGLYNSDLELVMTCLDDNDGSGCTTHYTLDGSTPTINSQAYVSPISITQTTTVRYFSVNPAGFENIRSSVYTIDKDPPSLNDIDIILPADTDGASVEDFTLIQGPASDESGIASVEIKATNGTVFLSETIISGSVTPVLSPKENWVTASLGPSDTWSYDTSNVAWPAGDYTITIKVTDNAGNQTLYTRFFTYRDIAAEAYTEITLEVSTHTLKLNDPVNISGRLSRLPDIGLDMAGQTIHLTVTAPDNSQSISQTVTNDEDGNYTFENVSVFSQEGQYLVEVSFIGIPSVLAPSNADDSILVGDSAGYAIIIQGKNFEDEGLLSHNLSANRIYGQFLKRGFLPSNIYYFNHNTVTQPWVDEVPEKASIQYRIESWAAERMNGSPAPLYIVFVDHGDTETLFLNDTETLSAAELNQYLSTLELSLNDDAKVQKRITIIGACYSGSFIPILSKKGRIVVTSAAFDEQSYRGTLVDYDPDTQEPIRVGEFFLEELFNELGRGKSLFHSFKKASHKTRKFTRRGGYDNTPNNRFFDNALQHPLLDDNGDGMGSNMLSNGFDDGGDSKDIYLGSGTDYNPSSSMNPADILGVTETIYLSAWQTSALLRAIVNDKGKASEFAWVEMRGPDKTLSMDNTNNQLDNGLIKNFMDLSQEENWEMVYDQFNLGGKYEAFYYIRDGDADAVSPMQRSIFYKNRFGNSAPGTFNLLTPDASQGSFPTVIAFEWETSMDPDGDPVTYNLMISTDPAFNDIVYEQQEIKSACTYVDIDGGLAEHTDYYWKVEAVDFYGSLTSSNQVKSFHTDNTQGIPGILTGYIYDTQDYTILPGAVVIEPVSGKTANVKSDGRFVIAVPPGEVDLTCTLGGYNDAVAQDITVIAGEVSYKTVGMTSNGYFASDEIYIINEDEPLTDTLTAIVPDGATALFEKVDDPELGVVTINSSGNFSYSVETPDIYGSDSFTFRVVDGNDISNTATVTINILPVNDAPVLDTSESFILPFIDVNDQGPDGLSLSSLLGTAVSDPDEGALSGIAVIDQNTSDIGIWQYSIDSGQTWNNFGSLANGGILLSYSSASRVRFLPDADGTANFIFRAWDQTSGANGDIDVDVSSVGGTTAFSAAFATTSIEVLPVNHPPVAAPGSIEITEDITHVGQLEGSDPDGDSITFAIVNHPDKGDVWLVDQQTGVFQYSPGINSLGSDSFTFKVNDGRIDSEPAVISVTIMPSNDAPQAENLEFSAYMNIPIQFELPASDPDNDPLSFDILDTPDYGQTSLNGNQVTYTATASPQQTGFTDSFTFKANDGLLDSNTAMILIHVSEQNTPPTASNDSITLDEDTSANGVLTGSDPDGDPLTFSITEIPTKGTVKITNVSTGSFFYSPSENSYGSDSFKFQVSDGIDNSMPATMSITITPIDDPPSISGTPQPYATAGVHYSFQATASDPDNDPLEFSLQNNPSWMTNSTTENTLTLSGTPDVNDVGTYFGISISVTDGTSTKSLPLFDLVVVPDDSTPVSWASLAAGIYNSPKNVELICNDPEGTIYYTTNGTDPTTSSDVYSDPILISTTAELKFFATAPGKNPEEIRIVSYVIDSDPPVISITYPDNDSTAEHVLWIQGAAFDQGSSIAKVELQITNGSQYLNNDSLFTDTPAWLEADFNNETGNWFYYPGIVEWQPEATYSISARTFDEAGNQSTANSLFLYSPDDSQQALTQLSIELSQHSIFQNQTIEAAGKLSRLPFTSLDLSGRTIYLTVKSPDGDPVITYQTLTYDSYGHFRFDNISGFTTKGEYELVASFEETALLAGCSASAFVQVNYGAGYVIMVQGVRSDLEGYETYQLSCNRIYANLMDKGFLPESVYYFSDEINPGVVDGIPDKNAIKSAVETWASNKIQTVAAPLYVILIGQGENGTFHLHPGSETILSSDLNTWMTNLENNPGENYDEPKIVILGHNEAGSFIPVLSGPNRTIVASCDFGETAVMGPAELDEFGQETVQTSDFFISEFFKESGRGMSIKDAFSNAAEQIKAFTRRGNENNATNNYSSDNATQHPILDDNGDGFGSHQLLYGNGDGNIADRLYIGIGSTDPLPTINEITDTEFITIHQSSANLWLKSDTNGQGLIWIGIRSPSMVINPDGGIEPMDIDLAWELMTYNPVMDQWDLNWNGFNESGKYELFYFVKDSAVDSLFVIDRSVLYKSKFGNNPPAPFSLVAPTDDSEHTTKVVFDWKIANDPDNDPVTYTLIVATDANFQNIVLKEEEIGHPPFVIDDPFTLKDLSTYYWKIEAVDIYGSVTVSNETWWQFHTDNTNVGTAVVTGKIQNSTNRVGIEGAHIYYDSQDKGLSSETGHYYVIYPAGDYTMEVTATDYHSFSKLFETLEWQTYPFDVNMTEIVSNNYPVISDITNKTINEDSTTGPIPFTVGDQETDASQLSVTCSSSNHTLVPNSNIVISGAGASRTATVTPSSDQYGSTLITLTVTDSGSLFKTSSFTLTVNSVNDTPTISNISDRTINEDSTTGVLPFTVSDKETDVSQLIVSGSSSNTTLVPDSNIIVSGTGGNRTVTVTPSSDRSGSAQISLTVTDSGNLSKNTSFILAVNEVNDPPYISSISNKSIAENSTTGAIPFTISDNETPVNQLSVKGVSNNTALVPNSGIVFSGTGSSRTVTVTPSSNQSGNARIDITVTDSGNLTKTVSFIITVSGGNDPPDISNIGNQTINEDNSTGPISFTITDNETPTSALIVSGSSNNTVLVPNNHIVFSGTGTNRIVTVTPAPDKNGSATITIRVTDSGNLSETEDFLLTINKVNDSPSIFGIPGTKVRVGNPYSFVPSAEDIDGDTLIFYIDNKPEWATFDTNSGALTGTPQHSDIGTTSEILIFVADESNVIDELPKFSITVENSNPISGVMHLLLFQ